MTPPDTNLATQKRRHRPLLIWMLAAIAVFVLGALVILSSPLGPEPTGGAATEAAGQ